MPPNASLLEQVSMVLGLLISPRRLPMASRRASTSLAASACILFGSIEAMMLIAIPYSSSGTRWPDLASYFSHIGTSAIVAVPLAFGCCAAPIALLSLFIYWISSDEAPILRSILLAPLPLFFPAVVWGVCHAVTVIGSSVIRGSPGWADFPIFAALGAIWLLPVFAITAYGLILWSARVSMRIKLDPTLCRACGYSLRGFSSAKCPECGTPFDPAWLAIMIAQHDAAPLPTHFPESTSRN